MNNFAKTIGIFIGFVAGDTLLKEACVNNGLFYTLPREFSVILVTAFTLFSSIKISIWMVNFIFISLTKTLSKDKSDEEDSV